ncbi:hypothetical protein B0H19DRAFT_714966 [Mycena capillaripes]|nr:hypothetical protein B0H19DRAFT_714966 [Mycena capillaripes]
MDNANPLDVEELLEHCISYLRHSPRELRACALVSCRWVYPAQAQLFRAPVVTSIWTSLGASKLSWTRFLETLHSSPHLIQRVRHIRLHGWIVTALSESKICEFPFTHLESVWIEDVNALSEPTVTALQQLLSLPTLQRLHLRCVFTREDFIRLWDRSSPGIRHLELSCQELRRTTSPDPPSTRGTISL